jgi:hypothetical protein
LNRKKNKNKNKNSLKISIINNKNKKLKHIKFYSKIDKKHISIFPSTIVEPITNNFIPIVLKVSTHIQSKTTPLASMTAEFQQRTIISQSTKTNIVHVQDPNSNTTQEIYL